MKKKRIPIHAVIWGDACHAMHPNARNTEPYECIDVGILAKSDKRKIVLIRQGFDDGTARHAMTIPRGMVKSVQKVGYAKIPAYFDKFDFDF